MTRPSSGREQQPPSTELVMSEPPLRIFVTPVPAMFVPVPHESLPATATVPAPSIAPLGIIRSSDGDATEKVAPVGTVSGRWRGRVRAPVDEPPLRSHAPPIALKCPAE